MITENSLIEKMAETAKKVCDELIKSYPADAAENELYSAELYSLTAGGKRIRPFLTLEFCRLFGGSEAAAMPFAQAIEMMHTFSLIHDDLPCMDNDTLRRGKPTNHVVFGEATALLAGDSLELRSVYTALGNKNVSPEASGRGAYCLSRCGLAMIEGQTDDMAAERSPEEFAERKPDEEYYASAEQVLGESADKAKITGLANLFSLQAKKTGALFEAAAVLGCVAAGLPDDSEKLLSAKCYARCIGRAFQIVDDILDATSTSVNMGKTVGKDERDGKLTFLSYLSVDDARKYAAELTSSAIDEIKSYDGAEALCALAAYLLERKK